MQTILELRSEIEASALRVVSANGFGEAVTGSTDAYQRPAVHLSRNAHEDGAQQFAETIAELLLAVVEFARRRIVAFQRWQRARATYLALRELDARILRDLGFHRSELLSVAAEVAGNADFTRARLSRAI